MDLTIPETVKMEHVELHDKLQSIVLEPGKVGEAARAVAKVLNPHLVREEIYAFPPLALLARVAAGDVVPEMEEVLVLTDRLKEAIPMMIEEHKAIINLLHVLVGVARSEKKLEAARFAEELIFHARTEEEILYPAALLVGAHIRALLQPA